jgi:hypothetical protein
MQEQLAVESEGMTETGGRRPLSGLRLPRPRLRRWQVVLGGGIALALLLWGFIAVSMVTTYEATVLFTESRSIGLPPPLDNLDFGDVPTGLPMNRKVTFENDGKIDTYMIVISRGGIRDFMSISDAFFNLAPGETKDIEFTAHAPANIPEGRHDGKVYVIRLPWMKFW